MEAASWTGPPVATLPEMNSWTVRWTYVLMPLVNLPYNALLAELLLTGHVTTFIGDWLVRLWTSGRRNRQFAGNTRSGKMRSASSLCVL